MKGGHQMLDERWGPPRDEIDIVLRPKVIFSSISNPSLPSLIESWHLESICHWNADAAIWPPIILHIIAKPLTDVRKVFSTDPFHIIWLTWFFECTNSIEERHKTLYYIVIQCDIVKVFDTKLFSFSPKSFLFGRCEVVGVWQMGKHLQKVVITTPHFMRAYMHTAFPCQIASLHCTAINAIWQGKAVMWKLPPAKRKRVEFW